MECPVCKEPLIVLELEEVEIDYCVGCQGIWLDEGELELLLGDTAAAQAFLATFAFEANSREKKRKCPICSKKMEKVLSGTDKNLRVDKCPYNDGIWFDRGELETALTQGNIGSDNKVLQLLKDMFGEKKLTGETKPE